MRPLQLLLLLVLFSSVAHGADVPFDPFFWLEEVHGEKALQWVDQENARTKSLLQKEPEYAGLLADLTDMVHKAESADIGHYHGEYFWHTLKNAEHPRGLLRRTRPSEYKKTNPTWETLLDIDELAKQEGINWIYKGAIRLAKTSSRRLLKFSRDGKDAIEIREYDYDTKQFITDGFNVPEAKTQIYTVDENAVYIATDFGPGSLNDSGYPIVIKLWHRGQPLSEAKIVFQGTPADLWVMAYTFKIDKVDHVAFLKRENGATQTKMFLQENNSLRELPIPNRASFEGIRQKYIYFNIREELKLSDRTIPMNSIVRYPLANPDFEKFETIFTPGKRQSIEFVELWDDLLIINVMDNIKSRIYEVRLDKDNVWQRKVLPFPKTGNIYYDFYKKGVTTLVYTDHLTPSTQYTVKTKDQSYSLEVLRRQPELFNADPFEVVQQFAKSKDGTSIPYFVLKKKDLVLDGTNPTILYGYGGFEISLTPEYEAVIGKTWLERGGVYAIANTRGGGEFGPTWHGAALRNNRQIAFDDFIAVAEDLISSKITSPRHLGIMGGSNGGLLVATVMVQRPELFNAVVSTVPLLDMARFAELLAGPSWIGEYGDSRVASDCEYLLTYSPYHNVKPGVNYPAPFFITSTADDRVHPGHARKIAMRMKEQGHTFYFLESRAGGHAASTTPLAAAERNSLMYSYFWSRLR